MADALVVGGGFGGLAAAARLRELLPAEAEITVVARDQRFFMGFAKLWELAGVRPVAEGTRELSALGDRGIGFVHAEVTGLDPVARTAQTDHGELVGGTLLVALGAVPAPEHRELLAAPGAHDVYDAARIPAVRAGLEELESGRVVVAVLGAPHQCPPAPFEVALIVDELLRQRGVRDEVEVVVAHPGPRPIPVAGPDASAYVAGHLDERGIRFLGERTPTAVGHGTVGFEDGGGLDYDLLLGVPASVAPPVLEDTGLLGDSGFVEPDPHTLATGYDGVYAAGDCTSVPTAVGALPKAGVFAAAEGEVAAANMAAQLGIGDGDAYDGHGYCFLELPGREVAYVEGDFYADPPDVSLSPADRERFERKQAYERERLQAWLG